ncbi:MAG: hypothetical protein EBT07_06840 [Actinobacteria bacterium]|nr:hypothetical protein [Actinomycetota bacterium]
MVAFGYSISALAQIPVPSEIICSELRSARTDEFIFGENGRYLTASTLRPLNEAVSVGRSLVKGALARKLTSDFDGVKVQWSSALIAGPVNCGSLNAFQISVDPLLIRFTN